MNFPMACYLLIQLSKIAHRIYRSVIIVMRKEVRNYEEVLEILETRCVEWKTTNKIHNSLWVKGIAFFDRTYCRVAFYDEAHNHLLIH